jgi:hypothetical protein
MTKRLMARISDDLYPEELGHAMRRFARSGCRRRIAATSEAPVHRDLHGTERTNRPMPASLTAIARQTSSYANREYNNSGCGRRCACGARQATPLRTDRRISARSDDSRGARPAQRAAERRVWRNRRTQGRLDPLRVDCLPAQATTWAGKRTSARSDLAHEPAVDVCAWSR